MPVVKAPALAHFEEPVVNGLKSVAKCKHCNKTVAGGKGSTSNLIRHLQVSDTNLCIIKRNIYWLQ